jgi:Xaa-Pro aminopeptidase
MNYIVFKNENALYFECKYSCDNAIFLKLGSDRFFITDGRYEIEAKSFAKNCEVIVTNKLLDTLIELLKKYKIKKITIDPKEWDIFSYNFLKENVPTKFKLKANFSHLKRIIKTKDEIELLKKAVKIGKESFKDIASKLANKELKSEYELNFLAESILRDKGARELSFEPIFAIDKNSALPHAKPTETLLKKGSLVLLDAGIKYKRYCSDRTRTAYFDGDINFKIKQKFKSKKMQKIYDTVLKAHDLAIKKAKVGMKASQIDKIARDVIEEAGYGKYFVHSTGHGVGLDIHEMPYISASSDTIIEEGMVFTIEPGIYIEGEFGVRIEDMVVMQDKGVKVL